MSSPTSHGGDKPPAASNGNGTGDASIRQRVGSLAAVNAQSLADYSMTAPAVNKSAAGAADSSSQPKQLPIHPTRKSSGAATDLDPYSASHIYYGASHNKRNVAKARTYSAVSTLHHYHRAGHD
jgi:alpha,alpha-trehalase